MKPTILNLLLVVVIVALSCMLIIERRKKSSIKIELSNPDVSWELDPPRFNDDCYWLDQSQPPPLNVFQAYMIADDVRSKLDECSSQLNLGDWQVSALSFTALSPFRFMTGSSSLWVYVVRFECLTVPQHGGPAHVFSCMILMDGRVVIGRDGWEDDLDLKMKKHYPLSIVNEPVTFD